MTQLPFYLPNGNLYISCYLNRLLVTYTKQHHNSILDVGCGNGDLLELFRAFGMEEVVGCDISSKAKKECSSKEIKFDIVDLDDKELRLPYNDSSFDVVVCTHVLEHLKYPLLVVKEMYRVAKDVVLFVVPAGKSYDSPDHIQHWEHFGELARSLLLEDWIFFVEAAISKPADTVVEYAAFVVCIYKNTDSTLDLVARVVVEDHHPHCMYTGK
jgi:ubiquinone/menaquinone biosynthesis C-methylase UbiE